MKAKKFIVISLLILTSFSLVACGNEDSDTVGIENKKEYGLTEAKEVLYSKIDEVNNDSRVLNNKLTTTRLFFNNEYDYTDKSAFYVNDSGEVEKALMDFESRNFNFIYKNGKLYEVDGKEKELDAVLKGNLDQAMKEQFFTEDYRYTAITLNTPEIIEGSDELLNAEEKNGKYVFTFETQKVLGTLKKQNYDGNVDSMTERTTYTFNKHMQVEAFTRIVYLENGEVLYSEESTVSDYKW